jgi:hypothetical protein
VIHYGSNCQYAKGIKFLVFVDHGKGVLGPTSTLLAIESTTKTYPRSRYPTEESC